ncbi:MAG: Sapep family Mn(2+)-dependent dipeptidase, partial [Oscillospiraceae bacterium]|nr:Sapep family Mn(2+)-dependent dipeptidase [Oscillospiraceae bacterium]
MMFGENVLKYRSDIIEKLSELVRIRSVGEEGTESAPFGPGPKKALDYTLDLAKKLGFKTKNVDGYVGYAEYGESDDYIAIITHIDVVPEGNGWKFDPYSATIDDGKIYGRGVSDNKCAAIAALYSLKTIKDAGIIPDVKIRILFGCCEESGMYDLRYYFTKEKYPLYGFVPDTINGYHIVNAEKGIMNVNLISEEKNIGMPRIKTIIGGVAVNSVPDTCNIELENISAKDAETILKSAGTAVKAAFDNGILKITSKGKAAHGSEPFLGENAVLKALKTIQNTEIGKTSNFVKFINNFIGNEFYGESLGISCK